MRAEAFERVVRMHLLTLLPGYSLEEKLQNSRENESTFTRLSQSPARVALKPRQDSKYRLILESVGGFGEQDERVIHAFLQQIGRLLEASEADYFEDLLSDLARRIVCQVSAGQDKEQALLKTLVRRLEDWATRTYEGHPVSSSVGIQIDPAFRERPTSDITAVLDEDYAMVIGNGLDTILVCDTDGKLVGLERLDMAEVDNVPLRLGALATWATGGNIAVSLNQHGELGVYFDGRLQFCKRSGRWVGLLAMAGIEGIEDPELQEAVYATCLDVSFARTGGCIGVVKDRARGEVEKIVDRGDWLPTGDSTKAKTLRRIVSSKRFQHIDRAARQELASMDGAVILAQDGEVLAVGAIIRIEGRADGGGRTAAAHALSGYGTGIKVSADGYIRGYARPDGEVQAVLCFGMG